MTKARKLHGYIRPSEAAETLGVTRHTIMSRVARGLYRSVTVAGLTFVHRSDIAKAVKTEVKAA